MMPSPSFGSHASATQLAALVLNFDQPLAIGGMIVDAPIGRKADSPWTKRRRSAFSKLAEKLIARCTRNIHAQIERCALQQRRPFGLRHERR
jgi:hypothetical protein